MLIRNDEQRRLAAWRRSDFADLLSVGRAPRGDRRWLDRMRQSAGSRSLGAAASDALGFVLATCVAAAAHQFSDASRTGFATMAELSALVSAGLAVWWAATGRYAQRMHLQSQAGAMFGASLCALATSGFLAFWTGAEVPRLPLLALWVTFPIAALTVRAAVRRILEGAGVGRLRVLVAGSEDEAREAADCLRLERGLRVDVIRGLDGALLADFHASGRLGDLLDHFGADRLILASEAGLWPQPELLEALARERVPFGFISHFRSLPVVGCEQVTFRNRDSIMVCFRDSMGNPVARAMKVALDLTLAAAALVVLSPLFLAIAVVIKADGGPVFFGHRRIGAGGRTFRCMKFRSMVVDSDRVLRELLENDPAAAREWAATQKLRRDPRVTWVGDILRRTSLDELPQLLNVLRLEMSLVGPRPIVAAEVGRYADDIAFYYGARPGLTGLWQISGRSDTSYERRVALDGWYVRNWTFWNDVSIILKTIPAVLQRKGAV